MKNNNENLVGIWATMKDLAKVDFSGIRKMFLRELADLVSEAAQQPLSSALQVGTAGELPKVLTSEKDEGLQIAITGAMLTAVQELVQQIVHLAVIELSKARGGKEEITNEELSYLLSYLLSIANDALLIAANIQVCLAEHGWPLALPALESLDCARKASPAMSRRTILEQSLGGLDRMAKERYKKSKQVAEQHLQEVTKEIKRLQSLQS